MTTKTMATYEGRLGQEYIEVSDYEYKQITTLLSTRPLFEVLAELEKLSNQGDQEIENRLTDIETRHGAALREVQQRINGLRADLQRADSALQEAARAGRYADAPTLEAKKVEINQAILAVQVELARTNQARINERSHYLESLDAGQQGKGPSLNGVSYKAIGNVARAVLWDWLNARMSVDAGNRYNSEIEESRWQVRGARDDVAAAEKALADFRTAAQARYSGAGVVQAAAQPPAKPTMPLTQPQPVQRIVSAPPPMNPGGIPNWGEVNVGGRR